MLPLPIPSSTIRPADVFEALWKAVKDSDCGLYYAKGVRRSASDHIHGGEDRCRVVLWRPPGQMPPPEVDDQMYITPDMVTQPNVDCIMLAHEFGHHRSHQRGLDPDGLLAFYRRLSPSMPESEKAAILASENRAWRLGGEALRDLGVTDMADFDRMRGQSLIDYRTDLNCHF